MIADNIDVHSVAAGVNPPRSSRKLPDLLCCVCAILSTLSVDPTKKSCKVKALFAEADG
ncbi:hypothetical protein J8I88_18105 (plasmid) [Duffyella gerundensis]|uniref:hypothetical protein n=1 Tax=Duffyella gerundensis TaxID=1619313 RepID=UPI001AE1E4E9|nr:hypothetical protein [Duffyella gerundensis]QTO56394.1 hypothetical protein J8I88_18105 [Duffyella gerundensis]